MRFMKLTLALGTLALAATAASHSVKLETAKSAGDKQLKPGIYKVEVVGDKAVFTSGKEVVEVPVTVQTAAKKYSLTSVQSLDSKITAIDLGGTTTKIVFGSVPEGSAAGK